MAHQEGKVPACAGGPGGHFRRRLRRRKFRLHFERFHMEWAQIRTGLLSLEVEGIPHEAQGELEPNLVRILAHASLLMGEFMQPLM